MRNDRLIEADVREALQWDERVDDAGIKVVVENGVVALIGHVHTEYEKEIAEHVANRIKGTEGVHNHLRLVVEGELNDDEIADEIRLALSHDLAVPHAERIRVSVHRGQATVTGEVPTHAERLAIEEDIRQTAGVVAIDNQVIVPHTHLNDQAIAQNIRRDLADTLKLDVERLEINSDQGVVAVRGCVPSLLHKYLVEEAAYFQSGVIHVINELGVAMPEAEAA